MSQNPSFIITGASGYMGLHLLKALSEKYSVKGTYANRPFPTGIQFDLMSSDPQTLPLSGVNYAVIFSAVSKIDFCKTNPELSRKINVSGVQKLLHELKRRRIFPIYASSDGVYPGIKGNYKESEPLLPKNNYSWSKLGGESSVQMYKNSLILRVCMTEKPFVHKKAFYDFNTNFIFHDEVAKILFKLINKKGIINLGGKAQTVYRFVKKFDPKIKKIYAKKILGPKYPLNPSMNITKLKKILK